MNIGVPNRDPLVNVDLSDARQDGANLGEDSGIAGLPRAEESLPTATTLIAKKL